MVHGGRQHHVAVAQPPALAQQHLALAEVDALGRTLRPLAPGF